MLLAAALASAAVAACSGSNTHVNVAAPAPADGAAGDGVRRDPVVAGRRARVFVMAGFDSDCRSLPEPELAVTVPPAKGEVSFEPGQQTTIRTSASGACTGASVRGTGIYYTARPGETGQDTFTVSATTGREATDRTFTVHIVD